MCLEQWVCFFYYYFTFCFTEQLDVVYVNSTTANDGEQPPHTTHYDKHPLSLAFRTVAAPQPRHHPDESLQPLDASTCDFHTTSSSTVISEGKRRIIDSRRICVSRPTRYVYSVYPFSTTYTRFRALPPFCNPPHLLFGLIHLLQSILNPFYTFSNFTHISEALYTLPDPNYVPRHVFSSFEHP